MLGFRNVGLGIWGLAVVKKQLYADLYEVLEGLKQGFA